MTDDRENKEESVQTDTDPLDIEAMAIRIARLECAGIFMVTVMLAYLAKS